MGWGPASTRAPFSTVPSPACADVGAELAEMDGEDDHIHPLVADPPQVAVARPVNSRKGVSARGWASATGCAPTASTCGRRRSSRPRLVAHRWRPSGPTSASSALLAGRANPALNRRACTRKIPVSDRWGWQACTSTTEATSASQARSGVFLAKVTTRRWTSLSLSRSPAR